MSCKIELERKTLVRRCLVSAVSEAERRTTSGAILYFFTSEDVSCNANSM